MKPNHTLKFGVGEQVKIVGNREFEDVQRGIETAYSLANHNRGIGDVGIITETILESREGPAMWNYQEYLVQFEDGGNQWVCEEDIELT